MTRFVTPLLHRRALWSLILAALVLAGCNRSRAEDTTPVPTFTPTAVAAADGDSSVLPVNSVADPLATALSATVAPTPTPSTVPTATPIPDPDDLLADGRKLYREGNYAAARAAFTQLLALDRLATDHRLAGRYALARTLLAEGLYHDALTTLNQLDAEAQAVGPGAADYLGRNRYLRARALTGTGDVNGAIQSYWAFLEAYPWMAEAVQTQVAALYQSTGDAGAAAAALRRAIDGSTDTLGRVQLLERLAQMYRDMGRYRDAATVYDEILAIAQNPGYRTDTAYAAGVAYEAAGDTATAIARWRTATGELASQRSAYLALIELVNRNQEFDLYQRGFIDLLAKAYIPAINAYRAYIESTDPTDARYANAVHELGQSYLGAGDAASALPLFERVIAEFPNCDCYGQAWIDLGRAQVALGDPAGARRTWRTFARDYATNALAGDALWASAQQALSEGNRLEAAVDFLALAESFPRHQRAPDALFTVATGAHRAGMYGQAAATYAQLQEQYPNYRVAAVGYWLGRAHEAAGEQAAATQAWRALAERAPDTYYGILANFMVRGVALTNAAHLNRMEEVVGPRSRVEGDDGSQAFAEAWLKRWDAFATVEAPGQLPARVAEDPDLAKGRLLLELDRRTEAIDHLERVYQRYKDVPTALYPLALEFARMGAYRHSITSMSRLLQFSPAGLVENAPVFLQRYVYPMAFEELITTEARAHDVDPFLYFSMIRQESLFEEGARSWAAAQGLAQIIPDTARWVAERQGHPEWSNELIYRPYINVNFGAYYFNWVREYLNGNEVSALVGYNAGPGNARSWRQQSGPDDALFVEILTFGEPRLYVQLITENLYHYTRLYGQ
jgi:soluble lytic murein transglycosylase